MWVHNAGDYLAAFAPTTISLLRTTSATQHHLWIHVYPSRAAASTASKGGGSWIPVQRQGTPATPSDCSLGETPRRKNGAPQAHHQGGWPASPEGRKGSSGEGGRTGGVLRGGLRGHLLIAATSHTASFCRQETERLVADPAPGIVATPHEDNLRYFDVVISGPSQSPFEGERAGQQHKKDREATKSRQASIRTSFASSESLASHLSVVARGTPRSHSAGRVHS